MCTDHKQLMLHSAQIMDSHHRILAAINGVIRAIEDGNINKTEDEENNLNIQITVANGVYNDKKYKGQHTELLHKLKNQFESFIGNVPISIKDKLKEYIDLYSSTFDRSVKNTVRIFLEETCVLQGKRDGPEII